MGRRRDSRRLAEGAHAAAGARVQRRVGQGARRCEELEDAEGILGLGADVEKHRLRLLSVHARDQSALRDARSAGDAARGGVDGGVRAPSAPRRRDARGRSRLGARDRLRGSARVLEFADGDSDAGRPRRGSTAHSHPREVRHVARHRPWQAGGPRVPHRPPRLVQRPHAGRHAVRRRNGAAAGWSAAYGRRRDGRARFARGTGRKSGSRYCPEGLPAHVHCCPRRWRRHDAEAHSTSPELPRQACRHLRRERRARARAQNAR